MNDDWRKSSYSASVGGQCIEVGTWRKSSYSASVGGQCVACGTGAGSVLVRDTTDRSGVVLSVAPSAWAAFLATIR